MLVPRYVVREHGLTRFGVWDTEKWCWVRTWGDDSFPPYEGVAEHRVMVLNAREERAKT